jgi:hypothetical protein
MLNPLNQEKFVEILSESATLRFGQEEARSLSAAILETAASLAVVDAHEIELEREPGFFL